jgi:hypothetical protein
MAETYKGFVIEPYEDNPGCWRSNVRKANGNSIKDAVGKEHPFIPINEYSSTAQGARQRAIEIIDAGGMS